MQNTNTSAIDFFTQLAVSPDNNPNSVKLANNSDYTNVDVEFISKYLNKDFNILDLGSGSGLIVNKIYEKVNSIDCVEIFKEFSQFIEKKDNITVINKNILDFDTEKKYDVILLFGIMHYFSTQEAVQIYKNCFKYLKLNGKIIIKNQFGIKEDVVVSGYSEEQKTNYFSEYRHLEKELQLLSDIGFKDTEVTDIYPPEANRWDNTHFYAIVAGK